ncbi:TPA: hypothetical protein HA338_15655 [Methanosarcina acetivorans]|uniref:Uncharacterized protein n=1 Tax=Methanosarcina acetivorans TaxID=2214 RepID=A0A832SLN9_9EURY|nr:hypothetical protein [Methanosarcina acetivorans]HIH95392.1 hypothetical protein [Methanosarcina acetivorans]
MPGILTGIAAIITAIGGILLALNTLGAFDNNGNGGVSPPTIESFGASPEEITSEQGSTLSWSVSDATEITIDPDIGSVSLRGSRTVRPVETTTYTLTASNDAGTVDATTVIFVSENEELPTIESFDADPEEIVSGDSATLSWSVSDATEITIDHNIGSVSPNDSISMSPTKTTTYTLTATNDAGSVDDTAVVSVNENVEPPTRTEYSDTERVVSDGSSY